MCVFVFIWSIILLVLAALAAVMGLIPALLPGCRVWMTSRSVGSPRAPLLLPLKNPCCCVLAVIVVVVVCFFMCLVWTHPAGHVWIAVCVCYISELQQSKVTTLTVLLALSLSWAGPLVVTSLRKWRRLRHTLSFLSLLLLCEINIGYKSTINVHCTGVWWSWSSRLLVVVEIFSKEIQRPLWKETEFIKSSEHQMVAISLWYVQEFRVGGTSSWKTKSELLNENCYCTHVRDSNLM